MWYFAWILGTGFACTLAVLNGIWFEHRQDRKTLSQYNEQGVQPSDV